MKYEVKILPTAWEDLKKIEDYYCIKFSLQSAIKVSQHILDTLKRLEDFPDSGSLTPDPWLNEQGYRLIICEKFVAIYKIIDHDVYVYHIGNTQTEYTKLFD
ncbi:type II toxin-antitoxin system RelE/ParE family toxin [Anaerosinus massiliensis]|uniref:type II toxin-antitoxin system RelE/ParE family toxin n=1 Tax=Massilibacillus massiliensis TaxID=1806837 RepID=UPI000A4E84A0|nr:type II toxin-antitoxin system RelE/ParE family toxin [Massilibacillus massiliensis]